MGVGHALVGQTVKTGQEKVLALRDVARGEAERDADLECAVVQAGDVLVFELDDDGFARTDIGHRGGEHVRTFLLQQAGALAGGARLFIDAAGFAAFMDLAFDEAVADLHAQPVDTGIGRQGKDISALDPGIGGVLEALGDGGADDRAGDVQRDVGGDHGGGDIEPGLDRADQQGAFLDLGQPDQTVGPGRFGRVAGLGAGLRPEKE